MQEQPKKNLPADNPYASKLAEPSTIPVDYYTLKSVTELNRIFMVDIRKKGIFSGNNVEMTLHFVNVTKQLGQPPKIKTYTIGNNGNRDEFL